MEKKLLKTELFVLLVLFAIGLLSSSASANLEGPIGYSVRSDVNGHLYSIDIITGVATDLGDVGLVDAQGIAFVGNTLYGIGGTTMEFWDITTPPGSKIGDTGPRSGIDAGLDYNPTTGKMYNIQGQTPNTYLYEVDLLTGAATFIGSSSIGVGLDGLAIDNTGVAYAADGITGSLYTVNLGTGALTLVGTSTLPYAECGLSFDNTGALWGIFDNGEIYKFNPLNGASALVSHVTLSGIEIDGFESLAILCAPSQVIPEVPLGTVMAGAAMVTAFVAYMGLRPAKLFRRRP